MSPRVREADFRRVLKKAGISEAELAKRIGIRRQPLDAMVRGLRPPSARLVRDGADVIADLLGEDSEFIRGLIFTTHSKEGNPHA